MSTTTRDLPGDLRWFAENAASIVEGDRVVARMAADEIDNLRADYEKCKEWCRKLIEAGDFSAVMKD